MTTTTWTTTADIPLNAWTPMVADMRALLAVAANGGATVTNADGSGTAQLDDDTIAFTVQAAPPAPPMTVQFTRAAGTGSVVTNAPTTGGLVVAALARAARYWGPLLTWATEADTRAHAVARELAEGMFGPGDRTVLGQPAARSQQADAAQVVMRAMGRVFAADPDGVGAVAAQLGVLLTELTAERDGTAIAGAMLAPHAAPAGVVAQVRAELAAERPPAKKAPTRRRTTKAAAAAA